MKLARPGESTKNTSGIKKYDFEPQILKSDIQMYLENEKKIEIFEVTGDLLVGSHSSQNGSLMFYQKNELYNIRRLALSQGKGFWHR